ncbi:unnamed protein product [Trifolium pratense]|uniref:Uncharacterized protein n=1 Tax=Trifolium pratense TaxID=57577 RepID=A0ACB0L109_TRIPR|nr:unnamed protein product [Trifolium pratense]
MPFGEMTITLDDVACLLHLPVRGQFYTPVSVSQEQPAELAVELLGEEYEFALRETVAQRGARAWMLMLVGSTILADKSYTRVDAKWLLLFSDLSAVHTYSWASIALVCLYDNLNDASMFSTRALAGYATLLQCWIHEYFPTLGRRAQSDLNCDNPGFPRAMRWMYKQGKTKLPDYRPILDALTPDDMIWRPFETHRGSIPFDLITLYSGHLRGSTVVPYLPESPCDNESPDDESDEDEESLSAGSAASPNRYVDPDIEEIWQLWKSAHGEQIVLEEVQQAFEVIILSKLSTKVEELIQQQQQQMLPPFPPPYDQLQILHMQESSSTVSVSATSAGQSQQTDIEEMWRLWKSKYDHIVQEKVQQAVRAFIESILRKVADEVPHQPMLMSPAADAASLSTSLLSSADVASISTSLLPTEVLAASSVSTPVPASSLLPPVLAASSVPVSSTSLPSSVSATTVLPARDD